MVCIFKMPLLTKLVELIQENITSLLEIQGNGVTVTGGDSAIDNTIRGNLIYDNAKLSVDDESEN